MKYCCCLNMVMSDRGDTLHVAAVVGKGILGSIHYL